MSSPTIERHRAAIRRTVLGRPLRLALDSGAISPGASVFDYGCGYGDDVANLGALGFSATGWDPFHRPKTQRTRADACYLGFVLNVIEHPEERAEVLRQAWSLASDVLVVGALVTVDARGLGAALPFGDGVVTRIGTFQKYFDQRELENLIRSAVGADPIALGMGAFAVFRDPARASEVLARRVVRASAPLSAEQMAGLLAARRQALVPLVEFFQARGRWPDKEEGLVFREVLRGLGSLARVAAAMEADGSQLGVDFAARRMAVRDDLEVVAALSRFRHPKGTPPLDPGLRHELGCHFGTLHAAMRAGEELLLSLGQPQRLRKAAGNAQVGKRMPDAIYVHESARSALPKELRLYDELGRAFLGGVEEANIIKLHLDHPAISYLSYPRFEVDAHPELHRSLHVDLQTFRLHYQVFERNPPILHRKELFVTEDHPQQTMFRRLTEREVAWDLFDGSTGTIGNRDQWAERLRIAGVRLVGHRLMRHKGDSNLR